MNRNKFINNSKEGIINEFFYLDVSKPFSTTDNVSILWIDLTYTGGPFKGEATACSGRKNNNIIFILGGYSDNKSFINQFDTSIQQWVNIESGSLINAANAPSQQFGYCAITLPDENILYIGSANFNDLSNASSYNPMDILPLYNTKSHMWTNTSISGQIPPIRTFFSAILTPDRRIIIFGSLNNGNILGDLWILDTFVFQWSIGRI
ncbi:21239_t:CDS:2 [Gigaspora margarita]|uniref:21239_t:CDS:1 n=1 Tax=Gigaspora margarita TaxID=4874 RepID=A0ABM8W5Y2_GIGMA|nr:21239_t:CDS:2 [Gigaspora margarita]